MENRVRRILCLLALGCLIATAAQAAPFQAGGNNFISVLSFENLYRPTGNCASIAAAGTLGAECVTFNPAFDPAGFNRVNVTQPVIALPPGAQTRAGDVLVGIIDFQNIRVGNDPAHFTESPTQQLTGYFAQEVQFNHPPGADPFFLIPSTENHLVLTAPTVDPFGILAPGEQVRMFLDTGVGATPFKANGLATGGITSDIAVATDGALFLSMGTGFDTPCGGGGGPSPIDQMTAACPLGTAFDIDGYAYSHPRLTTPAANFTTVAQLAFNLMIDNTGAAIVPDANDATDIELGGDLLVGFLAGNQIVGGLRITPNEESPFIPGGTQDNSPWLFKNDGILQTGNVVPEPGTITLMGIGLLGLVGAGWLRARKPKA
jgi:hypothetical protein